VSKLISQDILEIEVSGISHARRDVIEISDEMLKPKVIEDPGIITSSEIIKVLDGFRKENLETHGKDLSIDKMKSYFMSFLNGKDIAFALCKTRNYLTVSGKSDYVGLASLNNYLPDERDLREINELVSGYEIDISLGADDLYIGLERETALWFESDI